MQPRLIKIGTRQSELARLQTQLVINALEEETARQGIEIEIKVVALKTTGDKIQNRALREVGGKALFTKELDNALIDGRIDIAVHSAKDIETHLHQGIIIASTLKKDDIHDVLVSRDGYTLETIKEGLRFGTSSLRRQSQMLSLIPNLKVCLLRGNVQKRLEAVHGGAVDVTLLAQAGLNRLGIHTQDFSNLHFHKLPPQKFIPAAGQGTIAIACRQKDQDLHQLLGHINHLETFEILKLERQFLRYVEGDCHTPIGLFIERLDNSKAGKENFYLKVCVATPDGKHKDVQELTFKNDDLDAFKACALEVRTWLLNHTVLN